MGLEIMINLNYFRLTQVYKKLNINHITSLLIKVNYFK